MTKSERIGRYPVLGAAVMIVAFLSAFDVHADKFKVLYSFTGGSDGGGPDAGLLIDKRGNLYGTTYMGGAAGYGTVFKLASNGTETVLHSFCSETECDDGLNPESGLIEDKSGNFYGTTFLGGTEQSCQAGNYPGGFTVGCGVVFKLAPDGTESVLYNFCSENDCADGALAEGMIAIDENGNIYGATSEGGNGQEGTVFELSASGKETTHDIDTRPLGGVVVDKSGNLFGTAFYGGNSNCTGGGCGYVFKFAPDGTETVLYQFCGQTDCSDGSQPWSGLTIDSAGNLFGTTLDGGNLKECGPQDWHASDCGVVFKLAPNGTETVLYTFCSQSKCDDGVQPEAGLLLDSKGNLYGSTSAGGNMKECGSLGCGVAFRLGAGGMETVLHTFCSRTGCVDGTTPYDSLIADKKGNIYGTTYAGGADGAGVVFQIRQ